MNTYIPERNYYFLICDTPAIDAKHRIEQLNHMGFIADSNKENMVNYFQRFGKSKKPVIFIHQNKIRNLSLFIDQKEFDKLGIKQSYEEIPRLKLSDLMKMQFEDMEFITYNSLELLPDYRKTTSICREAVRIDPYNIGHIPDYMLSQEIIDSALRIEGNTLQYIPKERLNAGICHKAVGNDYRALQHVPSQFKSEELCRIAIQGAIADSTNEGYHILSHIPYTFICNEAIGHFNKLSVSAEAMAKAIVNKEVMSGTMCEKLFEWDYNAYKYFPHLYKTKDMTEKAVSRDGTLLAYVPPKQVNEGLCLTAINSTYKAMEFVPAAIKTADFCLKAVKINGKSIEFVPPDIKKEKNIFSFSERLDKILTDKDKLTFEQLLSIYQGNPILVKEVKSGNKTLMDKVLSFDRKTDRFTICNNTIPKKKKVFNKSI